MAFLTRLWRRKPIPPATLIVNLPVTQPIAVIETCDRQGKTITSRTVRLIDLADDRTDVPSSVAFAILSALADGPNLQFVNRADYRETFRVTIK